MTTTQQPQFPADYEDRYVETNFVLGSGYGYALAETDQDDRVDVVLVNEEAEPLVVLRRFEVVTEAGYSALTSYLNSLLRYLLNGEGERLQRQHTKQPQVSA
jgi:hypothetical protein